MTTRASATLSINSRSRHSSRKEPWKLYAELLRTPPPANPLSVSADPSLIAWLPVALQEPGRERFARHGRIAQEALGWEKLCAIHAADPDTDFDLGFAPPTA